jgi:hypothetical protein
MARIHRCPKCGEYFNPALDAEAQCPKCGIWFHKWSTEPAAAGVIVVDEIPEEAFDPVVFYGRVAGLLLVTLWGLQIASIDHRTDAMGRSFMHAILLPIHEAGHIFFMPLGEFMAILGGSFLQVALPFGIGAAFLWKQREPFGAAICLWWTGTSLMDLSPYVWDALHPVLMLTSGTTGEDGGHDWVYLLDAFGQLRRAHGWGTFVNYLGVLVMLSGIAWGAWYCWRSWINRPKNA